MGATAVDRKQYDVAVPMLEREYKRAKTRGQQGEIALNLATSYRETGRDAEAVDWYQTAYDNGAGADALREKAAALKRLERYEEAIQTYTDLGFEIGSRYEFRPRHCRGPTSYGTYQSPRSSPDPRSMRSTRQTLTARARTMPP